LLTAGAFLAVSGWPVTAQAQTTHLPGQQAAVPRFEAWVGGEAFHRMWSLYSGTMFAPFGSVREDGLRLRAVGGYGDHTTGTVAFADLLLGYHKQLGPLTIKFLAGVMLEDRHAADPDSGLEGADWGGKAVLETWWNITDLAWLSADVSWARPASKAAQPAPWSATLPAPAASCATSGQPARHRCRAEWPSTIPESIGKATAGRSARSP
jgi:hypothetical protein